MASTSSTSNATVTSSLSRLARRREADSLVIRSFLIRIVSKERTWCGISSLVGGLEKTSGLLFETRTGFLGVEAE